MKLPGRYRDRFRIVVVYRLLGKAIRGSFDEGPNGLRQRIAPIGLMNKPPAKKPGASIAKTRPVGWLSLNSRLELETKSKLYLARRTRAVGGSEQSGRGIAQLQESCIGWGENLARLFIDAGIAIVQRRRRRIGQVLEIEQIEGLEGR